MTDRQKTITIPPNSELGLTLKAAQASGERVVVDTGEDRYTLLVVQTEPEPDILTDLDPDAVLRELRQSRGALGGVDTEVVLADLLEQRSQVTIGCPV
jgi:hypothetical protein